MIEKILEILNGAIREEKMREKIQREAKMRNVKQGGFDTLVKLKMKADEVAE